MAQTIYCDESGATGNNLLDASQPYFVYSAIAISPEQAGDAISRLRTDFKIQGEIKGANLLKNAPGQQAISRLLNEHSAQARLIISDTKYALACKLFEYVFEPVIAERSLSFYRCEFHLFISHLLWVAFQARSETATNILSRFQTLMRERNENQLVAFLTPEGMGTDATRELQQIITFAAGHHSTIWKEIEGLAGEDPTGRWILDLTTSSLFSILRHWGCLFDSLEVYCDDAKPLRENIAAINGLPIPSNMDGNEPNNVLTFRLEKPIELVRSIQYPGIQVADVFASSLRFAMSNPLIPYCGEWLEITKSCIHHEESVRPQEFWHNAITEGSREVRLHRFMLAELAERTSLGSDLHQEFSEAIEKRLIADTRINGIVPDTLHE